jgi:hypothetical protein
LILPIDGFLVFGYFGYLDARTADLRCHDSSFFTPNASLADHRN